MKSETTNVKRCESCGGPLLTPCAKRFCSCRCANARGNHQKTDTRVTIKCRVCGRERRVSPSQSQQKFCSPACYGVAQRCRKSYRCPVCGRERAVSPSLVSRTGRVFCSSACAVVARRVQKVPRVTIRCVECGRERQLVPCQARQREGRHCSQACFNQGKRRAKAERAKAENRVVLKPQNLRTCVECGAVVKCRGRRRTTREKVYCSRECRFIDLRRNRKLDWDDKAAVKTYMQAYTDRNREKANERSRRRNKLHRLEKIAASQRYRARLKANTIERIDYREIVKRDGMRCHICRKAVAAEELGFDHVIPLARGGMHVASNIAVCHRRCNSRKSDSVTKLF